ncbi:ArnT family glycosyltransferase [Maribacter sp. HTCC2170]|uniref:ArnT family glycosyltransferase n=1 Tax=Maribacter sp. (strain HTCC2170 / KCCM 42371) TaxID=313603 RepID=UPI00006B3AD9|nr:glycosyltransferase family 39 protein [Maribacter sp. HTCC2170]EAQ99768.1 hypothetical protein FB2170_07429 [Maribacter sp. HTCC2170]
MFNELINSLFSNLDQLKNRTVFKLIFAISFFLRLPFFFRDYIDRDESTFILMGQSWVDGNLPYTELWDLKPPITFLFFAGIIYVFGKSFIAIRIIGSILVALTAFFTYKIGQEVHSKRIGLLSGIICVVLLTLFGSLQGVMSEHICMAFFMPGLYLVIKAEKPQWFLLAGLFMGLALMTKMNIAYAVLCCGLFIIYLGFKENQKIHGILKSFLYGIGILSIIGLTVLPYYFNGISDLWWNSVILAPLEYIGARRYSILKLAPIFLVILGFFFLAWKKKWLNFKDSKIQLLLVAVLGIMIAFYKGGRINGHYLIQLHPILVILVVLALIQFKSVQKLKWRPFYLVLLFLIPMESYLEYGNIIRNKFERGTFFNGEGFSAPKYIKENQLETENILFLGYHIGYWNLNTNPPTKSTTHPSNICRDELFPFYDNQRKTSIEELQHIMEVIKPKTIVTRKNRRVFDKEEIEANEYIDDYLDKHYKAHTTVEKAEILQRLD